MIRGSEHPQHPPGTLRGAEAPPLHRIKLVSWLVAAKIGGRDRCIVVVQRTPVSAGDDSPLCVVVSPVPAELREVEELMLQRGVVVSYETIRQWCATFGQVDANRLRRRRARPGDKWAMGSTSWCSHADTR